MVTGIPLLGIIAAAVALLILLTARWRWHPFFALFLTTLAVGLAIGLNPADLLLAVKDGFGGLIGSVGLLIVLGSVIGICLERSGAARRIADVLLGGGTLPGLRLVVLGALISIPVFCDSGFIILAGLLPALARQSGRPLAVLALSVAGGLYLTHTLVPPTPGPLAAAANLGAEGHIGTLMLLGLVVCVPVSLITWKAAGYLGRNLTAELHLPTRDDTTPPSLAASLLPLLLPIVLIALGSVIRFTGWSGTVAEYLAWFTDPTIALALACLPALRFAGGKAVDWIGDALSLGAPIVIITGLGGAFGAVLKASSLADDVAGWVGEEALSLPALVLIGWLLAALLKSAQGSSTAALVIASGIVAPLLPAAGIVAGTDLACIALGIGGGAMTVSHANDSYFWVVTRFAGIPVGEAYRGYTVLTGVMGVSVLCVTLLMSILV